ncbi:MAG TPA: PQQ-dependent sugar dehydrogenase [Terriglobales bacterium]|nr:PQQ-dependent sugar dehydrogenase [Terriglobales bacterium]
MSSAYGEKTAFDLGKLQTPAGFHISVFANVDGPRMMVFSPGGVLIVSESGEGKVVALPDAAHTGKADRVVTILDGLNEPHGLGFYEGKFYVAENDKVRRYDWDETMLHASNPKTLTQLPGSGGHSTRSLLFHGGKMYVSAGSSCNVCIEKDPRRATVMEFNPDGSGQEIYTKGLRNAVGLALNPKTDTVWVTVNGRDMLGDDVPPETIYDLGKQAGGDAGWPYCYGDRVPDSDFTKPGDGRCNNVIEPKVQMQAHSAPLGLAFYEGSQFPAEYQNNIFVAFHGSWNRSVPTGYKVVRVKLDDKGQPQGGAEDFITGWLAPGETKKGRWMGRPVGIVFGADGTMYLSDDSGGVIYRITFAK